MIQCLKYRLGIIKGNFHQKLNYKCQRAKKVVSDSLGLVDFAVGLVNSFLKLPDGQVSFLGEMQITEEL